MSCKYNQLMCIAYMYVLGDYYCALLFDDEAPPHGL